MALNRKEVLAEFRRLEEIIQNQGDEIVNLQVEKEQAIARADEMAEAALNLRSEEVQERLDYQETNTRLIEFVKVVAESKSKFGKEAREILGM